MKTYKIETDEKTLGLISKALDFYSRVGIGQFKEILDHPTFQTIVEKHFTPEGIPKVGDNTPYGKVVEINDNTFKSRGYWTNKEEIREFPIHILRHSVNWEEYHDYRDKIEKDLSLIKDKLMFTNFGLRGHLGIYNNDIDDSCRQAFDIHQVIRHEFWKENPNRSDITVDSSIHYSSDKGIKFKII